MMAKSNEITSYHFFVALLREYSENLIRQLLARVDTVTTNHLGSALTHHYSEDLYIKILNKIERIEKNYDSRNDLCNVMMHYSSYTVELLIDKGAAEFFERTGWTGWLMTITTIKVLIVLYFHF